VRRVGYISPLACIGEPAECRADEPDSGYYIAPSATIEAFATIDSGTAKMTRIDADAWVFKHAHIAHDCHVMEGAEVSTGAVVGGHCIIGPYARIGLNATLHPWITVGRRARIGCGANVVKNVPPGETWVGNPARRLIKPPPEAPCEDCKTHCTCDEPWRFAESSSEHEHTTRSTNNPPDSSTSPATNTDWCGPETSSPATAADATATASSASPGMSVKPSTILVRRLVAANDSSEPRAAKDAHTAVDL
jgi:carbonic anhydrase/acetyltransferase-like protein (isoleucine patch superfamily)